MTVAHLTPATPPVQCRVPQSCPEPVPGCKQLQAPITIPPFSEFYFTEREREVLVLVQKGLKRLEISKEMHINLRTIDTHFRNIYRALKIKNFTQLIIILAQNPHIVENSRSGERFNATRNNTNSLLSQRLLAAQILSEALRHQSGDIEVLRRSAMRALEVLQP